MPAADQPTIEAQRADLLAVYQALAQFARERAERRAAAVQRDADRAGQPALQPDRQAEQ